MMSCNDLCEEAVRRERGHGFPAYALLAKDECPDGSPTLRCSACSGKPQKPE